MTLCKKHTMFIRHQILWTIRVIKNTSLRSIRWVYTEWKQKNKHENSTLESKYTAVSVCCDQWSHPPHVHVGLISVSLEKECWPCSSPHIESDRGHMGPPETHTGPVWNQNSDMYPNIVWWVNKKCDPLPDLGEDCKSAAWPHLSYTCKQSSWAVLGCYWHKVLNSSKPKQDAPF